MHIKLLRAQQCFLKETRRFYACMRKSVNDLYNVKTGSCGFQSLWISAFSITVVTVLIIINSDDYNMLL